VRPDYRAFAGLHHVVAEQVRAPAGSPHVGGVDAVDDGVAVVDEVKAPVVAVTGIGMQCREGKNGGGRCGDNSLSHGHGDLSLDRVTDPAAPASEKGFPLLPVLHIGPGRFFRGPISGRALLRVPQDIKRVVVSTGLPKGQSAPVRDLDVGLKGWPNPEDMRTERESASNLGENYEDELEILDQIFEMGDCAVATKEVAP
jgi:hypothetical protein